MLGKSVLFVVHPGPRPPIVRVAEHLWGVGVDFDSDGNSSQPNDTLWTELTLQRRPSYDQRVDVDPTSQDPLVLRVASDDAILTYKVANYLAEYCRATVVPDWPTTGEE